MLRKNPILILIFFLSFISLTAQTKSNLEVFYHLVDTSVSKASENIPTSSVISGADLQGDYYIFRNLVEIGLSKKNIKILADENSETEKPSAFNYVINNADVKYSDMFRQSFLGEFYTERVITLKGTYFIKNLSAGQISKYEFEEKYIDTIKVDEIKQVENQAYDFTQGEIPAEPFFSSLFEPVVAIGAAAIAVYLFFSIRSK